MRSVPPEVAGGFFRVNTHPLPQMVLTSQLSLLNPEHVNEFLHGRCALLQRNPFF